MNYEITARILETVKDGEQRIINKKNPLFELTMGKLLSYGVTPSGFPFVVWETRNFGSIMVGISRWNEKPKSQLRNDATAHILLNNMSDRMATAIQMSHHIVH